MTSTFKTIVGYVTPRPFGQFYMPVPAQNSCLREYAISRGFTYALPQCEHIFDDCYVQFFGTLNSARANQAIVIYSSLMLPKRSADHLKMVEIIAGKNLIIHTVLENLIIQNEEDFLRLQEVEKILKVTRNGGVTKIITK